MRKPSRPLLTSETEQSQGGQIVAPRHAFAYLGKALQLRPPERAAFPSPPFNGGVALKRRRQPVEHRARGADGWRNAL